MITRIIRPLWLREKISYKIYKYCRNLNDKNISLQFNKQVKLDLVKTDVGHKSIILNGFYELGLSREIVKLGAEGSGVLVDVGANYGYFSCLWAAQNARNKVFAFEASPVNIVPLMNNINKNKLNERITIVPIAVGKEAGTLGFNLGSDRLQTGWGGLSVDQNTASIDIEVEVVTLDAYTSKNGIEQIDLLKIDTEGADTWVLYGAAGLLKEKRIKHIFFEHNEYRMQLLNIEKHEAEDFLKKMDYKVSRTSPDCFYACPKT